MMILSSVSCLSVVSFAASIVDFGYTQDSANAENPDDKIVAWEFYDDGVLKLYGDAGYVAWEKYADQITSVIATAKDDSHPCAVTIIPKKAFYGYKNLTTVDLKEASKLYLIDAYAFNECTAITSIDLPNNVESLGDYAFYGCSALVDVKLSPSLDTIGSNVFKGCSALETVVVPNGVTEIGYGMFEDCAALTTINLPDSIEEIGAHAFEGCSAVTDITVSDSVTTIGAYAFYESGVKTAYIGHNVAEIGSYIFGRCASLEEVTFTSNIETISDWMFYNCTSLKTIVDFPESVEKIGEHAFEGCSALTEIIVPNTVTVIGDSAFAGCSALADVTLSTALTDIGANAFNGSSITSIDVPYNVKTIGAGAFANCSALTAINVAAANTAYKTKDGVLYTADLSELIVCPAGKTGDVVISEGTQKISSNAFLGCANVASVTIPASVTDIDVTAFNGCADALVIKTLCNAYAAEYAKLFGINIDITHTGDIEWTVTKEPDCTNHGEKTPTCSVCGTLQGAPELIDPLDHSYDAGVVTKKPTCTETGIVTFTCEHDGCIDSYTETLPSTGHNMDGGVVLQEPTCDNNGVRRFSCQNEGCYFYEDYPIPATGHSYDDGVVTKEPACEATGKMVYTCTDSACGQSYEKILPATGHKLGEKVIVKAPLCEETGYYEQTCQNGCGYVEKTDIPATQHIYDKGTLTKYPTVHENGEYTYTCQNEWCTEDYPNHFKVHVVTTNAFDGILDTNKDAYADENGIQNLTWFITDANELYVLADNTAEEWGKYRESIVVATIAGDATTVENGSFAKMPNLTEANIFLNLGTIEAYAFQECPRLEKVVTGSIEEIGNFAFNDCIALKYVDIYGGLDNDKVGGNIFDGCRNLETVILGNGCLELGYSMFKDCSALSEIHLPKSITIIGDSAFDGTSLKTIDIPANVEMIKKGAFTNCNSLAAINVDNKNDFYFSVDGVLYDVKLNTLMLCPAGKEGEVTVWNSTTAIADDAFIGCKDVTKVIIPDSVMQIAANAFNNCATDLIIKGNCDSQGILFAKSRGIATEIEHVAGLVWQTKVEPNCLDKGLDELVCSGCGEVEDTKDTDALGHNYNTGVVTTDPTCETDGVMTYSCQRDGCTDSYTKPIPATKHNFDSGKVISAPTCEEKGTMRYACQNAGCLESFDEDIKALGHALDAGTVITPVTCEADGLKIYKCTNTGCLYEEEEVLTKLDHSYVSTEIKKATCLEDGKIQHVCTNCGDSYVETTKGEHVMYSTPVKVNPTCTQAGKEGDMCAVCRQFIGQTTEIPATGHKYENGVCSGCGASDGSQQKPAAPGGTVVTPEGSTGGSTGTGSVAKVPATPKLLLLVNRNEGLVLTWKEVEGAKGYRVYRRAAGDKSWTYLATVEDCTYVDKTATTGEYWRYTVRATNDAGFSGFENGIYIKRVATPHLTSIANVANGVKVTWNAVSNAKSYKIYRRGAGETWKCIATVKGTSYVDTAIKANSGNYYRYTVRAIDGYYSAYETGLVTKYVAAPHLTGIANTSNGVKVNWNAVNGADSYRVYRRAAGQSWVYVTTVTGTSYVDTAATASGYYRYTVRAVDGSFSAYESGLVIKK